MPISLLPAYLTHFAECYVCVCIMSFACNLSSHFITAQPNIITQLFLHSHDIPNSLHNIQISFFCLQTFIYDERKEGRFPWTWHGQLTRTSPTKYQVKLGHFNYPREGLSFTNNPAVPNSSSHHKYKNMIKH
jgi:hypothetical protein